MVLQSRQNMKKPMYLGPFHNKILFRNQFLFLFFLPLKYFSLPVLILQSEQIVKKLENKIQILFLFFSHPPLKIFQNSSALNKV
jgi:hypothetical protein